MALYNIATSISTEIAIIPHNLTNHAYYVIILSVK